MGSGSLWKDMQFGEVAFLHFHSNLETLKYDTEGCHANNNNKKDLKTQCLVPVFKQHAY